MYVCMYVWLCWVFVSVRGLPLVAASGGHSSSRCGGHSSSRCTGLSLSRPLAAEHRLQTRRLSYCGSRAELLRGMWDLPRPGLEPMSLHWQADSQPLRHQGSPLFGVFCVSIRIKIICSSSVKKAIGILIRIALNL